jgi:hypothetical protein
MERIMTEDWETRARDAAVQRRTIWFWSPTFLAIGALAVVGGTMADTAWIRWPGIICGGLLAVWGFLYGTAVYMRTVDEQERDANLWGCYVGMCVYFLLFALNALVEHIGQPIPHAHYAIFFATMISVLGVFAWKRFR